MSNAIAKRRTDLTTLFKRANEGHEKCTARINEALRYALASGEALTQAKGQCPHGTWSDRLAKEFVASQRTAQLYMWLNDHKDEIEAKAQDVALLNLT